MAVDVLCLGAGLSNGWSGITAILERQGLSVAIAAKHDEIDPGLTCRLGILLGYNRIVPPELLERPEHGFVLFHSSALPEGRGWAPIYHTIAANLSLTVTLLYAAAEVDAGDIIARATYPLGGSELEPEVRTFDDLLVEELCEQTVADLVQRRVAGQPQDEGRATWWEKRSAEQSRIDPEATLAEQLDHIRALPDGAPAFFEFRGRRFTLTLASPEPAELDRTKVQTELCY